MLSAVSGSTALSSVLNHNPKTRSKRPFFTFDSYQLTVSAATPGNATNIGHK
ncbi:asl0294 [Nostoc sp. PCC 7120 = FACHB-418]|nr:asl0294 [Nostoc sp. PCC 7120 = FACHB-418]